MEAKFSHNVSYRTFVQAIKFVNQKLNCDLQVGMAAPNPTVHTFDNKTTKLLDFVKQNRPLVVNFGSCT